jgi:two-component system, chemotaxis family, chemotaxis protein CheY
MANILLIEDDIQLAEVYTFLFEYKGHTVVGAGDGEEGLVKVADAAFDLIIVDMMMPKLDGLGFLERYNDKRPANARIILLSNMESREYETKARALGVNRYEIKASLAPEQLLAVVDEVLAA